MYIFSIDTEKSFSILAKCAGRRANAIKDWDIYTFRIKRTTDNDVSEVSAVCVRIYLYHLYKENTWTLCQVRNVLHLHPRAKESRPHVLFLAKMYHRSLLLINLVMRELSGPFYKKRRGMMLCWLKINEFLKSQ